MVYSAIITFGAAAICLTDAANGVTSWPGGLARRILAEPLRGNTHPAYVGLSTVTNNGTGAAIQELAQPAAGVPLDRFNDPVAGDMRLVDPGVFYVHGTSGEKAKVTLWSN